MARAKRAFGLVLRTKIKGKPVDLRHNELWAVGAEILLREGVISAVPLAAPDQPGRGGDAAPIMTEDGMRRLLEYYDGLISQYPYNRLHPDTASSLHFYRAKLACQIDQAYSIQKEALRRLEAEEEAWNDDGMVVDHPPSGYDGWDEGQSVYVKQEPGTAHVPTTRRYRFWAEKNRLREQAVRRMDGILSEMEKVMNKRPFTTDRELLRLRGMAALCAADLSVPTPAMGRDERRTRRERKSTGNWRGIVSGGF